LVGFLAFLVVDGSTSFSREITGTVVEKIYHPAQVQTSVDMATDAQGSPRPVIATSYESEEWIIIVRTDDEAISLSVESPRWAGLQPGQQVTLRVDLGGLSGWRYDTALK
jgi:hypothetical protein